MSVPDDSSPAIDSNIIQRVLYCHTRVHVYSIPPLLSTRGFNAGPWTAPPNPTAQEIFLARLRVIETSSTSHASTAPSNSAPNTHLKADILLEDPSTGELFANCPYTSIDSVQAAQDSSRFSAIRVIGGEDGKMRATLGIGFEERADAVDLGIALGEVRKVLKMNVSLVEDKNRARTKQNVLEDKKDWKLKDGESIVVQIGGIGKKVEKSGGNGKDEEALFSIAPPPSADTHSYSEVDSLETHDKTAQDRKRQAEELGFDDGEFGEFQ